LRVEWVTNDTVDEVVALGQHMHAESRFRGVPLDVERLRSSLVSSIADESGRFFLALVRSSVGDAAGGLFGRVERPYFTSEILAHDYAFFVDPAYRGTSAAMRLLRAFRLWAAKRGAIEVHVSQTVAVDPEGFDRLMRRCGFGFVGGNYALPLS